MKKTALILIMLGLFIGLTACENDTSDTQQTDTEIKGSQVEHKEQDNKKEPEAVNESEEKSVVGRRMKLQIGTTELTAVLENNESVDALLELMKNGAIEIDFSQYGGFEQVGDIGTSLPRNDVQTTTSAGDIMLYSGSQMVLFYGSNSWAYTRLGKFENVSDDELQSILGNGDIHVTLSLAD